MEEDTDNHPISDPETSEDNLAVDGLLREFFRHPLGADENYIRRIMNIIEKFGQSNDNNDDDNDDDNQTEPEQKKGNLKDIFKKFFLFY